ncbi:homoserine O-acetyltransferase family protein [Membranihabitans maritimus]|uniref:homoserine O-acetyltransferase family protein n=1 Tax=Membranihabitans maritimus TaxID=2904244 RepID=UPI001F01BDF2|nr:homoserine O-acetyltransferase [Membranihabitans maritimus]
MSLNVFKYEEPFSLESGEELKYFELGYSTMGTPNSDKSNVVWICHALTANSNPEEWWPGLVGNGKVFDPKSDYIICVNMLSSCYGSTNPSSINPETSAPYGRDFPLITIRDMVRAMDLLRQDLGIESIEMGAGGSMGGQQLLEWAILKPDLFRNLFVIGTNAVHSPWGIAFNEAQRMALDADPTLWDTSENAGKKGLQAARAVAMLSYRNYTAFWDTQQDDPEKITSFRASSYQQYQGEKLSKRFNAQSYYFLSKSMDTHNVGRNRGSVSEALSKIKARTLVIGINTDFLFPPQEQKRIASGIPHSEYHEISTPYGHDGFLIEWDLLDSLISSFKLKKSESIN